MRANWSKESLEKIVYESTSRKDVLIKMGIRNAGSNFKTLKKYLELYSISTSHFIKNYDKMINLRMLSKTPMSEILVENSTYSRHSLKNRLYKEGYMNRECCLCGQNENWNEMKISLILDHMNGVHNDNRIENLRIVCPNCNAGLDTFAGKNVKNAVMKCKCGCKISKKSTKCMKCEGESRRKYERPPMDILVKEVDQIGYSATGRKYGVSDNTIRKWIKRI